MWQVEQSACIGKHRQLSYESVALLPSIVQSFCPSQFCFLTKESQPVNLSTTKQWQVLRCVAQKGLQDKAGSLYTI